LRHPAAVDLWEDQELDDLRFDTMQQWLILADTLAPIIANNPPPRARSSEGSPNLMPEPLRIAAAQSDDPCENEVAKEKWRRKVVAWPDRRCIPAD
jgi:hypothetical protein